MPQGASGWFEDWPFAWIYLFFVLGAALRSQALYWVGRGAAAGVLRTRWSRTLDGPRARQAVRRIERWGMPVVPVSFLTVGLQSAVHAACGLLRLHWWRYTLWSVPGWLVWALVWAGGGTAALWAAARLAAASPLALAAVLLAVGCAAAWFVVVRRRGAHRAAAEVLGAGRG